VPPFTYEYPRPALTVDNVVLADDGRQLHVLLIERGTSPFAGSWALPGGYVEMTETLEHAARRELEEETGLTGLHLEQLHAFGALDRHPTERVVSVAYFALVKLGEHTPRAGSDARRVAWFAVDEVPPLAFDHSRILDVAVLRVRDLAPSSDRAQRNLPPRAKT
jgi:8-oxo-dGTP diphosphatase